LEEDEVLDELSENLKDELIVHLNGKMVHDSNLFRFYNLHFLSDLTFILKRESFDIGEPIFDEDEICDRLHYITKGNVRLIHKKTATFIAEVSIDTFIGEVSFFSGQPRKASARSIIFTEVITLYLSDFLDALNNNQS
jgi:CRP-like cAMP-binding protein